MSEIACSPSGPPLLIWVKLLQHQNPRVRPSREPGAPLHYQRCRGQRPPCPPRLPTYLRKPQWAITPASSASGLGSPKSGVLVRPELVVVLQMFDDPK